MHYHINWMANEWIRSKYFAYAPSPHIWLLITIVLREVRNWCVHQAFDPKRIQCFATIFQKYLAAFSYAEIIGLSSQIWVSSMLRLHHSAQCCVHCARSYPWRSLWNRYGSDSSSCLWSNTHRMESFKIKMYLRHRIIIIINAHSH